jgi:hypothetical protein
MRSAAIAFSLLCIAGAAPAEPEVSVELRAQQPTYALGKPVEMTAVLSNRTERPIEVAQYPKPWGVVAVRLSATDTRGRPLADARMPIRGKVTPTMLSIRPGSYLAVPVCLNHHCYPLVPGELDVRAGYVASGVPAKAEQGAPASLPVRIQLVEISDDELTAEASRLNAALLATPANGSPHYTIFRLSWTGTPLALATLVDWLARRAMPWDSWYVEDALRCLRDDAGVSEALVGGGETLGTSRALANALRSFSVGLSQAMPAIVGSLKRPEQEYQRGALWLLRWYGESHDYTAAERKVLYPLVRRAVDARDPLVRPSAVPVLKLLEPPAS